MNTLEQQKRIYFLFSAMENMEQHDRTIYQLVVDYFIDNGNNYAKLIEITNSLLVKNQLQIDPEHLDEILRNTSKSQMFDDYDCNTSIEIPIRLKKEFYDSIANIGSLIDGLQVYVCAYLESKMYPASAMPDVIELLLEAIFKSNLRYLKDILTSKQEKTLTLKFSSNNSNFSEDSNRYYNNMLLDATPEFDDILSKLIMRMFDFLSLNCAIDKNQILTKRLANKCYYLDSSFILRLLGFDNEYREIRSVSLINILKSIKDCRFCVHFKTLEEAQSKIDYLIASNNKLLELAEKETSNIQLVVGNTKGKGSNILDLFNRLKRQGKVSTARDFALRFSQIKYLLFGIISSDLKIDKTALSPKINSNRATLANDLSANTSKTTGRITHIVKLLDYIEKLRGSNNYNPFDIEYWLITTDQNTLELDGQSTTSEDHGKSICIMPTELIRMVDGVNEIVGEHLDAFKKFIMNSHGYAINYTKQDIDTVVKFTTMVDGISNYEAYNVEFLIENFFATCTLQDLVERTSGLNDNEQTTAIIDAFIEANEAHIKTRDVGVLYNIRRRRISYYRKIFAVLIYMLPALLTVYIILCFMQLYCEHGILPNWINPQYKDFLIFILSAGLYIVAPIIYKKYKDVFSEYFTERYLKKIQNKD